MLPAVSARMPARFRTGDIATIDPHGYLQVVDRSKDVIKSGGEWISASSIAMRHPSSTEPARPAPSPIKPVEHRKLRTGINHACAVTSCVIQPDRVALVHRRRGRCSRRHRLSSLAQRTWAREDQEVGCFREDEARIAFIHPVKVGTD
jgi:acyl-CoA synthetase (AMP-forming)/AMP-acid ligase II